MDEEALELARVRVRAHMRDGKRVAAYERGGGPSDAGPLSVAERAKLAWARGKSFASLRDERGPAEKWLRENLKKIGINPYAIALEKLDEHADQHARAKGVAGNRKGSSRYWFKSPCWALRDVDFTVHQVLPLMLAEQNRELAEKLISTSPRWQDTDLEELLEAARPAQRALVKLAAVIARRT